MKNTVNFLTSLSPNIIRSLAFSAEMTSTRQEGHSDLFTFVESSKSTKSSVRVFTG